MTRLAIVAWLTAFALTLGPLTTVAQAFSHCPYQCAAYCKKNKPNVPGCQATCEHNRCNL